MNSDCKPEAPISVYAVAYFSREAREALRTGGENYGDYYHVVAFYYLLQMMKWMPTARDDVREDVDTWLEMYPSPAMVHYTSALCDLRGQASLEPNQTDKMMLSHAEHLIGTGHIEFDLLRRKLGYALITNDRLNELALENGWPGGAGGR